MIAAALRYFALIFAIGFLLGTVRTLWLAPWIGPAGAVLAELPLMLGSSWIVAGRIVRRARLLPCRALGMGIIAFALLMAAEALLALTLGGQNLRQWAADLLHTPGWIGLAGQALFGLFPFLAARRLRPAGD